MNDFLKLIENAKTLSTNMVANTVTIDGITHKLYAAVLHSNWTHFKVDCVEVIRHWDKLIHGQKFVDKEAKLNFDVDSYYNIIVKDGDTLKSITIEYNSVEARIV